MNSEDNYWQRRVSASRLSRRTFIGGAAAGIGATGLALAGCSSSSNNNKTATTKPGASASSAAGGSATASGSATSSATPKTGGSYTEAYTGVFAGVDPHTSVYGGSGIIPLVYNYLIRDELAIHPEKGVIEDLAESHTLQDDKVTWVFKIRPNVMIAANSQGVPVRALDSGDALASWQRIMDPATGANGFQFVNTWVDKIDAPDATTFRMIMKKPYAFTEASVGNNLFGPIVPKEWLANANLKKTTVGGGAFTLTELVESDHATMVKNPTYYKKGKPYLDKILLRSFADQATERTAFTGGQLDAYGATDQDEAKSLASNNKSLQYSHHPTTGFDSFWMNTKIAPWSDPRVRKAVNESINRKEFISIVGKGAGEVIGPLSYVFKGYLPSDDQLNKYQPYDAADAKKLFSAAGISEFTFSYPTAYNVVDYVNIFVRQLGEVGVTAKAQAQDAGTWLAQYYTSKLTASLTLNQEYQTPDVALQWFHTGGITGNNHYDTGFSDPALDTAIDKAASILDLDEQKKAYIDLQVQIMQASPPFFNFFGLYGDTLVYPYIHNDPVDLGSLGFAYQEDIWTDKA